MAGARVIVFGYGPLAIAGLGTLAGLGVTPVAVVVPGNRTGPDVDVVAAYARANGLPLLVQPPRPVLEPFLGDVRALRPDVLFVWSYSMLLAPGLLALAPLGAVNIHGGLLPEYRGGHVMNWAIINGETQSGASLHYLDAGIDTGPVVADERFSIGWHDDAASVQEKLKAAGTSLLTNWWPAIEAGAAPRVAQDESRAHYYPMRTARDGRIDWTSSNVRIYNLVRALVAPWPGADTRLADARLVVRRVEPLETIGDPALPGTVLRFDEEGVRVASGAGDVRLVSVEIDGRLAGHSALQRAGLAAGVQLR